MNMNQIEPTDIIYEVEGQDDEPQVDAVYIRNGKGQKVKLEVVDDA